MKGNVCYHEHNSRVAMCEKCVSRQEVRGL